MSIRTEILSSFNGEPLEITVNGKNKKTIKIDVDGVPILLNLKRDLVKDMRDEVP